MVNPSRLQGGLGDVGKFAAMHAAAKGAAGAQIQYRLVAISEAHFWAFCPHPWMDPGDGCYIDSDVELFK